MQFLEIITFEEGCYWKEKHFVEQRAVVAFIRITPNMINIHSKDVRRPMIYRADRNASTQKFAQA